jgi:hypothetical protein
MSVRYWNPSNREISKEQFLENLKWARLPLWEELMAERCYNCRLPLDDCACCVGCGETDADIVGSHGYQCVL